MKSTIKIDVDHKNNPIILVRWEDSDDVRDKLVKRWIEGFGYSSNEAKMSFLRQETGKSALLGLWPVLKEDTPITDEMLILNPDLKEEGLKVGDKIGIPSEL